MKEQILSDIINDIAEENNVIINEQFVKSLIQNLKYMNEDEYIPENPLEDENKKLKIELKKMKDLRVCPICKGEGGFTEHSYYHSFYSTCDNCNGAGLV
jgi:hypothetical protein